ncbi:MAG: OFA family MFS transporter [Deltaproteobacteria bacterium]|nr:OFA family MFS transporter [Deltaproteobacteria bacterium]
MDREARIKGWTVTLAGTGINLALGILYTWSIFKVAIEASITKGGPDAFAWDKASLNDPYALCCLVFSFAMIFAGRLQDRVGPRITAFVGGILVGAGFIWISQTHAYVSWVLGFGVLVGAGLGFGYGSATPPALKWFPPAKTGLIAGIVVSGFGLASVYIAPLAEYLVGNWGLQKTMLFFGVAFCIVVCGLSMLLKNPPPGYSPTGQPPPAPKKKGGKGKVKGQPAAKSAQAAQLNTGPMGILKTGRFWMLWLLFFIGAGAGLMVISSVGGMAKKSLGEASFIAVAMLAIGNAGGRILAGFLSDKIGRIRTLTIMLSFQAVLMFLAIGLVKGGNPFALVALATLIGFNYGTNLSLFPSITKDLWGLSNFGINYGFVFSAWGVGGLVFSRLSEMLKAASGNFDSSFMTAGLMLVIGALLTILLGEKAKA